MKRTFSLLLVFSLPLLGSCGRNKDIVVETDLNEKVVVKDSAVSILEFSWIKAIDSKEKELADAQKFVLKIDAEQDDCSAGSLGSKWCSNHYRSLREEVLENEAKSNRELATLKKFSKTEKPFVQIRYRPIFVNVNDDKSAMSYVTLTCLNPEQTTEESAALLAALGESLKDIKLKTAYYTAGLKVCQKYAYDDAKVFAYRLSEDTDTEAKQ